MGWGLGQERLFLLFINISVPNFVRGVDGSAQTYLQLPLLQWSAGNVYLLVLLKTNVYHVGHTNTT